MGGVTIIVWGFVSIKTKTVVQMVKRQIRRSGVVVTSWTSRSYYLHLSPGTELLFTRCFLWRFPTSHSVASVDNEFPSPGIRQSHSTAGYSCIPQKKPSCVCILKGLISWFSWAHVNRVNSLYLCFVFNTSWTYQPTYILTGQINAPRI